MTKSQSIAEKFLMWARNYAQYGTPHPEELEATSLPDEKQESDRPNP